VCKKITHSSLRNNPKEGSSLLFTRGSPKSHIASYIRSDTEVYRTAHITYVHGAWKRMVVFGRLRLVIRRLQYIISQRKGRRFLWLTLLSLRLYVFVTTRCHDSKHHISLFFFLFCTVTNDCTIISQIITLLHVSTLSYHPQGIFNFQVRHPRCVSVAIQIG